jgi:Flp pilus assembly protein CpaB
VRLAAERAEDDRKAMIVWKAKVAEVYPAARKALIEARNRGSQAPLSIRKAVTKKETDKAAAILCKTYDLTRDQLDRLMVDGKDQAEAEASPKKKPAAGPK